MSDNEQIKPIRKTWIMLKKAILGMPISSLPLGALVKDVNSVFLGSPVIWKIADFNHIGYPENSVTLITNKSIALRCFDAVEPTNPSPQRAATGNGRYETSNVRQWLNSDAAAGQWYVAQHAYDQAPNNTGYTSNGTLYANKEGFLNGFSEEFKKALLDTTLITANNNCTYNNYGEKGGKYTVIDKIFLPSPAELNAGNTNNIAEGSKIAIFSDYRSRQACVTAEAIVDAGSSINRPANDNSIWDYWTRSPEPSQDRSVRIVYITSNYPGNLYNTYACRSTPGIRPLCNLPITTRVSETPDEDGCYRIVQFI